MSVARRMHDIDLIFLLKKVLTPTSTTTGVCEEVLCTVCVSPQVFFLAG